MSGGPFAFFTVSLNIGVFIILAIVLLTSNLDELIITSPKILSIMCLISLFAFLGYTTLLVGFQKGNVSVGGIILSSRVFVSIPLAFFLIGERYSYYIYILLIFSLGGSIMVSWTKQLSMIQVMQLKAPGMKWFILTSIFWATSNFLTRYMDRQLSVGVFLLYRQILMIIMCWIFFRSGRKLFDTGPIIFDRKLIRGVLTYLGVLLFAQFCFVYSLGYSLTISEGIGISEGFFTLIFSLIIAHFVDNSVLNEPLDKHTLSIRFLGAAIAGISTLLVVLSV